MVTPAHHDLHINTSINDEIIKNNIKMNRSIFSNISAKNASGAKILAKTMQERKDAKEEENQKLISSKI
jgi:hypothetical protein